MKTIVINLEEEEYNAIKILKGDKTWKECLLNYK